MIVSLHGLMRVGMSILILTVDMVVGMDMVVVEADGILHHQHRGDDHPPKPT